jgi:very-short-patch-repair endonuclease
MAGMLGYWYRLYHNMTPAEKALEPAIAALGERYRSQHPILKYKLFADFALLDRKLIIEVDGDSHDKPSQIKKDLEHTIALKSDGWEVTRVSNEQALANPVGTVVAALTATPQTLQVLESRLARLKADYPALFEPKTVKRRRGKAAGRKRASGRRRRPGA